MKYITLLAFFSITASHEYAKISLVKTKKHKHTHIAQEFEEFEKAWEQRVAQLRLQKRPFSVRICPRCNGDSNSMKCILLH